MRLIVAFVTLFPCVDPAMVTVPLDGDPTKNFAVPALMYGDRSLTVYPTSDVADTVPEVLKVPDGTITFVPFVFRIGVMMWVSPAFTTMSHVPFAPATFDPETTSWLPTHVKSASRPASFHCNSGVPVAIPYPPMPDGARNGTTVSVAVVGTPECPVEMFTFTPASAVLSGTTIGEPCVKSPAWTAIGCVAAPIMKSPASIVTDTFVWIRMFPLPLW